MIAVDEALRRCLALAAPLDSESAALGAAHGRYMSAPATASCDAPPFDAAAMDGYAVIGDPVAGARFRVIGEAGAGHAWHGTLSEGQAARIFTGAPMPAQATRVVIQEDVLREGDEITLRADADTGRNIRPAGQDFRAGDTLSPRLLGAGDIALLAAMNIPHVRVTRRPIVALIPTGDELIMPGETPKMGQITASSVFALQAMCRDAGAEVRILPIARDNLDHLTAVLKMAEGADLILTTGGASAGDHDLVARAFDMVGMSLEFHKIAMRPGKPLMAARWGTRAVLGLPGNPVSSVICAQLFAIPMLRAMLGYPEDARAQQPRRAVLTTCVAANGPRSHYMRAKLTISDDSPPRIAPFERQDSALLSVLAQANALIIRPPHDAARGAGCSVSYIAL